MAEFTAKVVVIMKLLLDIDTRKMTEKLFLVLYIKQDELSQTNEQIMTSQGGADCSVYTEFGQIWKCIMITKYALGSKKYDSSRTEKSHPPYETLTALVRPGTYVIRDVRLEEVISLRENVRAFVKLTKKERNKQRQMKRS